MASLEEMKVLFSLRRQCAPFALEKACQNGVESRLKSSLPFLYLKLKTVKVILAISK